MNSLRNNDAAFLENLKGLISERNEAAIEMIYDHYYDKLVQFAQTFGHSREDSEEFVDDIIIKLWSNPLLAQGICNLSVYLINRFVIVLFPSCGKRN
jgi:RNA polymerase sigma-70 factor (ECF subfamily)